MRAPAETLQKLAEAAPQGWGCAIEKGKFVSHDLPFGTYPEEGDVENAQLTAWCKKQLREKGWWWRCYFYDSTGFLMVVGRHEDHEFSLACPTEWQAVAECLIAVLEKGTTTESVKRGIKQSKAGQTHGLGSFAKYAEENPNA